MPLNDIRYIILLLGVVCFVMVIIMQNFKTLKKMAPGFGWFTVGVGGCAAAFFLVGLRGMIPNLLSVDFANLMLLGSMILFHHGFNTIAGKKVHRGVYLLPLLFIFTVFLFFSWAKPDSMIRIILVSSVSGVYQFIYFLILIRDIKAAHKTLNMMFAASLLILSSLFFLRAGHFLFYVHEAGDLLMSDVFHGNILFGISILAVFFLMGVIDMNFRALRSDESQKNGFIWKQVMESAGISMFITDIEGKIEYVNNACCLQSGYTREELLNQDFRVFNSDRHDHAFFAGMWANLKKGKTWQSEVLSRKKEGELHWESVNGSPVFDEEGDMIGFSFIKEDIAEKKRLETLKEEIAQRLRHDLKQPLSPILTFPFLLKKKGNLEEKQIQFVTHIEEAGKQLSAMIDLSRDIFMMEKGEYHYKPSALDILKEMKAIIESKSKRLTEKQISLVVRIDGNEGFSDSGLKIVTEKRLFNSMFLDLFNNAMEASGREKEILIELESQNDIFLKIQNSGVVPEKLRETFFDKYKDVGKKGKGIGTYKAKLYADTLGYDLSMQTSDVDQQTCILIKIPDNLKVV